ncbi:MAG: cobalamin B12-binding domain-containing protein [Candidatus Nealsonbacteria bacterium]|nr:cobalamin B12-binding domain-containing protein [Candidatus Nealsonbacteria bacterium]
MKIRVLLAKPGLDGHDRGIKIIARALRDAGMEVIYTGLRQTPKMIVKTALEESVDVIGLSILSGAHLELLMEIMKELKRKELKEVMVVAGGIIPEEDIPLLEKAGIRAVFGPGSTTKEIIEFIQKDFP